MIYIKAGIITIIVIAALLAIAALVAFIWPLMVIGAIFTAIVFILKGEQRVKGRSSQSGEEGL